METNREEIGRRISEIISNILEKNYQLFEESEHLINDIGIDSMGLLELNVAIQREFDISLKITQMKDIQTIKNLIDVVAEKTR